MPVPYYIGSAAHIAIAEFYKSAHIADIVEVNVSTVMSIVRMLEALYDFKAGRVKRALGRSKPDIFDFSLIHPPCVYEIKSWKLAAVAEFEALFYSTILIHKDTPAIPGPMGAPGTFGVLAAPHGWFQFEAIAPGAIVYWYRRAPKEKIMERGQVPVEEVNVKALREAAGVSLSIVTVLAALLTFLEGGGWLLAL
jgi:hypothetical protein